MPGIGTPRQPTGVHHLAETRPLLNAIFEAVKPGGRFVLSDVAADSPVATFLDGFVGSHYGTGRDGFLPRYSAEAARERRVAIDSCEPANLLRPGTPGSDQAKRLFSWPKVPFLGRSSVPASRGRTKPTTCFNKDRGRFSGFFSNLKATFLTPINGRSRLRARIPCQRDHPSHLSLLRYSRKRDRRFC